MNPVGLRLNLLPEVLAKLVSAVADKFKHFVRIKRAQHTSSFYEVDLSILDAYDVGELDTVDPEKRVTTTREMVGELFDLLGLFPRGESPINVTEIKGLLVDINLRVDAISELLIKQISTEERERVVKFLVPQYVEDVHQFCRKLDNMFHI